MDNADKFLLLFLGVAILGIVILGYFIFFAPNMEEECLVKIADNYCKERGLVLANVFVPFHNFFCMDNETRILKAPIIFTYDERANC